LVDQWGVSLSYLLPGLCFVVIGLYAMTARTHEEAFHAETSMVDL
jgi:hypothetical protein